MKTKSPRITAAAIASQRLALQAQLDGLAQQEQQVAAAEQAKLAEYLKTIPGVIAKMTGKEGVTVSEVISLLKKVDTGTLGKVGVTVSNHGQHAKRLTEAEELTVKEAFIGRAVSEALGQPQKTVSAICNELNISGQTYDVRRKKYIADATVTEEIARRAAAMKPAPVAALATA